MKFQIENYENMTVEEKLAALEAYEPTDVVSKATFDKTASELAAAKKRERERMTEDEAKAAKEAEERAALEARVKELEHERSVSGYMAAYAAMGYDEKLAAATAEALATGDTKTVFENQKAFLAAREKALRAEILKATPAPDAGAPTAGVTKEAFDAMGYKERAKLFNENPELYNQLNGGNE